MCSFLRIFGYFLVVLLFKWCQCEVCNRIPLGITTNALPPDNRYSLHIENIGDFYLPGHNYNVTLKSNGGATFIAFTITAIGEERNNTENPRRPVALRPGQLIPASDEENAKLSDTCADSIIQNHNMPKTSIKVNWKAPPQGNGCVTISALVAIRDDIYFNNQGPLTTRVCEDIRKPHDMPPKLNPNCAVCYDAKYKLTFEGQWAYNTHLELYPLSNKSSINHAAFSDIVGASHNSSYSIFRSNDEASEAVRILAEQGNTTELEMDMQKQIGKSIRTIIKANHPPTTTSNKTAMFRVSEKHHLVSVVTAILPSPDWFLGGSNLELCDANTNQWTDSVTLNLYPVDAGTDKGTDFNSANDKMMPAQPIALAKFTNIKSEDVKPFARIHFHLIRIYDLTPGCFQNNKHPDGEEGSEVDENGNQGAGEGSEEHPQTTTTSEAPVVTDPDSTPDCPMTSWEEWEPCEGNCVGGRLYGAHSRYRYHIVDNVPFKYSEEGEDKVPKSCMENNEDIQVEMCEEDCEEPTTASIMPEQRVAPGRSWKIWS